MGYVVLERGRIGETWRMQRWDPFTLNTPTWMSRLPVFHAAQSSGPGRPAGRSEETGAPDTKPRALR